MKHSIAHMSLFVCCFLLLCTTLSSITHIKQSKMGFQHGGCLIKLLLRSFPYFPYKLRYKAK